MHYLEKLRKQNEPCMDRLYQLFKVGVAEEAKLTDRIHSLEDEIRGINACPGADGEIKGICKRALGE